MYDCDCTFGNHPAGNQTGLPQTEHIDKTTASPTGFIAKYYSKELTDRYKYLAEHDIISSSNIFALIKDWCDRIGTNFYKEEYKKWKDSPCISDSVVRSDYWEIYTNDNGGLEKDENESFDATQSYNVGDVVSFGLNSTMGFFKYRCIKQTTALDGNTPHSVSAYSPIKQFKHCDNLYRIQKWIEQSVINMDKLYNYTRLN